MQKQDDDIQRLIGETAGLVEAVEQLCQQQQARGNIGQVIIPSLTHLCGALATANFGCT